MKRIIKFRAYTEISNEVLGMKYDVPHNYNDTVMQFTGLLDRNGKEIYEGDIVKINSLENTPVGAIEWDNDMTEYMIKDNKKYIFGGESVCSLTAKYFEVIGNIYENPELLDRVEEVEEIPIMKGTREALDKLMI